MDKILSVIVPSFNTAAFIDKNIPTLLDEKSAEDLEVLIINDGSTDGTAAAAHKYEELLPGTVKVINKENGGHGSAINSGIDMARGRYFKVVDGDDRVDARNFRRLIEDLKNQDADLVLNPFNKIQEKTGRIKTVVQAPDYGVNLPFENVCAGYRKLEIHSITIKTGLLRDNGIRVREKCYYEDNEYDLFPVPFIETVTVLDYPVYQYLVGQAGQSVSAKSAFKNRLMRESVLGDCIRFYESRKSGMTENKRIYMRNAVLQLIRTQYNIYLRNASEDTAFEEFMKFNKRLKSQYPDYFLEAGNRYRYIKALQTGNRLVFSCISVLVRRYKRES